MNPAILFGFIGSFSCIYKVEIFGDLMVSNEAKCGMESTMENPKDNLKGIVRFVETASSLMKLLANVVLLIKAFRGPPT